MSEKDTELVRQSISFLLLGIWATGLFVIGAIKGTMDHELLGAIGFGVSVILNAIFTRLPMSHPTTQEK